MWFPALCFSCKVNDNCLKGPQTKPSALFSDQGCRRGGEGAGEEGEGDSIEGQSQEGQCDHAEKCIEDEKRRGDRVEEDGRLLRFSARGNSE